MVEADAEREQSRRTQWLDARRTQTISDNMATANQIRRQLGYVDNLQKALALTLDPNTHQPAAGHEQDAARYRQLLSQYDVNALHANLNQVEGYIQKLYDPNFNYQTGLESRSPIRALGEKLHLVKPQASPLMQPQAAAVDPQQYDTKLTPEEEQQFQTWKQKYAPQDSGQDYDLRGAFKAGLQPDPQTGHWPDTFKKPNHPTFSNQSMYASQRPDLAGSWQGDQYIKPQPQPKTAGELIRGLQGIRQKYDIAAPGVEAGEQELAGEEQLREQERAQEQRMDFIAEQGKKRGWSAEEIQSIQQAGAGGYKPVAPRPAKVKAVYQDQTGKQYQEYDDGTITTLGGDKVPPAVLNALQLTPLSKTGAANLKLGTLAYFLNSAYGPTPTPQQQAEGRRIWTESAAIERQTDGTIRWIDSNNNVWEIPETRTTKPVPSGLTPPAPYQPSGSPGARPPVLTTPVYPGPTDSRSLVDPATGLPSSVAMARNAPQITPGATSATGATDVTTAPQGTIGGGPTPGGAAPTPAPGAGPTPPVAGARFIGPGKETPVQSAAHKKWDEAVGLQTEVARISEDQRKGLHVAARQHRIVEALERATAGRFSLNAAQYMMQAGLANTIEQTTSQLFGTGELPDDLWQQVQAAVEDQRAGAEAEMKGAGVAIPKTAEEQEDTDILLQLEKEFAPQKPVAPAPK